MFFRAIFVLATSAAAATPLAYPPHVIKKIPTILLDTQFDNKLPVAQVESPYAYGWSGVSSVQHGTLGSVYAVPAREAPLPYSHPNLRRGVVYYNQKPPVISYRHI